MSRRTEAWIMLPVGILLMLGAMSVWSFVDLFPNNTLLEGYLSGLGFAGGAVLITFGSTRVKELSREKKRRR